MTNLPKRLLSPLLNWLLEPLVCRIDDRLRESIAQLDARLDARLARQDAALFPRLLPVIVKNELRNIEYLPRDILDESRHLHFVGYYAADVASQFHGAVAFSPVDLAEGHPNIDIVEMDGSLIFLDEYHFQRFMETRWSSLTTIAGTLLIATRFEYLRETECRSALHSLGFIEVAWACRSTESDKTELSAVSHAEATNCMPRYIHPACPRGDSDGVSGWLVARRVPRQAEERTGDVA